MPRRQALPAESGLAIIELQGRFYPVRVEHEQDASVRLACFAHLLWETHQSLGIPFASGPQPTQGIVSFGTWKLAYGYCQRHYEQLGLPYLVCFRVWRSRLCGLVLGLHGGMGGLSEANLRWNDLISPCSSPAMGAVVCSGKGGIKQG